MSKFEKYIKDLSNHEVKRTEKFLTPRNKILVYAGINLNWLGDYLANPNIKYKKVVIPVEKILFTGTGVEWNKILIDKCERKVEKFKELVEKDEKIKERFLKETSFTNDPLLVRGPDENGFYKIIDGMHRFVGAVLKNKKNIEAYIAINDGKHLPICEPHVVYDLIRGFQRNAQDKQGEIELYHSLKLLSRTYENVTTLLKTRFNSERIPDEKVQKILKRVLGNK